MHYLITGESIMKKFLIGILYISSIASACSVTVSQWTMENFEPADYVLCLFTDNSQKTKDSFLTVSKSKTYANIVYEHITINAELSGYHKHLHSQVNKTKSPVWGLYYKNKLFIKFNDTPSPDVLLSSPLRTTISEELTDGSLGVMLVLLSGNKNDKKTISLVEKFNKNEPTPMKIHTLNRYNPKEKYFIELLLKTEKGLEKIAGPMVFGIFGRFRILEPLFGEGITEENLGYMISFLQADCSCVIKGNLPGIDMLAPDVW
jgi:hypothetical protein